MTKLVELNTGRLGVYSVYDIKAQSYLTPFFSTNNGTAVRSFGQVVNDSQSFISKHPEDYSLFRLGSFDDLHGTLYDEQPLSLGVASSYLNAVSKV